MTKKKEQIKLLSLCQEQLMAFCTELPQGELYDCFIDTKAGKLKIYLETDRLIRGMAPTISICMKFENPEEGRKLVECNPFSGKWNFYFLTRKSFDILFEELKELAMVESP